MLRSQVFEETYRNYLLELEKIDYLGRAEMLGADTIGNALEIPLYDKVYRVSDCSIDDVHGESVTPAVRVILCKYVLMCTEQVLAEADRLKSYREFKDAGPLISYFTTNTNKTIETTFSGRLDDLRKRAQRLGGSVLQNESYDFSVEFLALPRIPVIVNFNDRDDMFPAACSILYRASAERFLDMECLAMTGTLLAGKLIAA